MDYHAHAILDMMEGRIFTDETLLLAIQQQFGTDATFHTCSVDGKSPQDIITFLKNKGKFIDMEEGYTVNTAARCKH
ncbi:MAG: YecH family protein [Bacteroidales bacterium]|nr:YecH family protein [Bacteroidales bacterium]